MTRYTLNLRFVLTLATVTAVAAAAVWFVHRSQAGKQAGLYLARADALERDGDKPAAVEYLRRYLALRPSDTATRERFGLLLADTATDAEGLFRALLVLDQSIRDNPTRRDLRRRAAAVGLFLGPDTRPGAIEHYTALINDAHPDDDVGAYYGRGNCHELGENFAAAAVDYREVVRLDPTHAAAAGRLAGLLRGRLAKPDEADGVIKRLVEHAPRAAAAQLTAAVYWREVARAGVPGERPAAERKHAASAAAALELDPGDPAVVQVAADLSLARCQEATRRHDTAAAEAAAAEAVRVLEQGIAAARMPPAATTLEERVEAERARGRVAKLYQTRAVIALTAGQYDEAERWVTRGLDVIPDAAGLNGLLVEVYTQAGRLDKAEAQIARLRDLRHPDAAVGYRQARVHAARGEWLNAVRACEAALPELTATPDLSREVQYFLAECFEQVGQPDRRQAALREAVPADPADPLWVPARAKLADALLELGRLS
ncbi:MAG: tetratricopeptide repeat protein, partial [Gemmataceae bacterium]